MEIYNVIPALILAFWDFSKIHNVNLALILAFLWNISRIYNVNLALILAILEFFENLQRESSLNFYNKFLKSDRLHEKDRVPEKKMSGFEKFSNRFFEFEKNSQI